MHRGPKDRIIERRPVKEHYQRIGAEPPNSEACVGMSNMSKMDRLGRRLITLCCELRPFPFGSCRRRLLSSNYHDFLRPLRSLVVTGG